MKAEKAQITTDIERTPRALITLKSILSLTTGAELRPASPQAC